MQATGAVRSVGPPRPSADGDAVLLPVVMDEEAGDPEETIEDVVTAVEESRTDDARRDHDRARTPSTATS